MVTYEITADVEADLIEDYERYMREVHIPELLETGCFRAAAFTRSRPGRYRVRYEAPDQADLDRYLAEDAPRLRAEFSSRFPRGIALSREVWATIEEWGHGAVRARGTPGYI
ncbi:MAG TPA: DUF4286 family protein [Gemmatimonadales bacterium]|nr:DUF4286 family protein [Gemmatimonadales bacterium]